MSLLRLVVQTGAHSRQPQVVATVQQGQVAGHRAGAVPRHQLIGPRRQSVVSERVGHLLMALWICVAHCGRRRVVELAHGQALLAHWWRHHVAGPTRLHSITPASSNHPDWHVVATVLLLLLSQVHWGCLMAHLLQRLEQTPVDGHSILAGRRQLLPVLWSEQVLLARLGGLWLRARLAHELRRAALLVGGRLLRLH